jgi:hypothetical protein
VLLAVAMFVNRVIDLPGGSLAGMLGALRHSGLGRVLKRSHQTFRRYLRVRTQDVFASRTAGQQLEDVLDADPGSADT